MHLSLTILFNVASCNMRNVGVERERFVGERGMKTGIEMLCMH